MTEGETAGGAGRPSVFTPEVWSPLHKSGIGRFREAMEARWRVKSRGGLNQGTGGCGLTHDGFEQGLILGAWLGASRIARVASCVRIASAR
jgi:hypothetical protein